MITVLRWLRKIRHERRLGSALRRNAEWAAQAREAPPLLINWLRDHPDA